MKRDTCREQWGREDAPYSVWPVVLIEAAGEMRGWNPHLTSDVCSSLSTLAPFMLSCKRQHLQAVIDGPVLEATSRLLWSACCFSGPLIEPRVSIWNIDGIAKGQMSQPKNKNMTTFYRGFEGVLIDFGLSTSSICTHAVWCRGWICDQLLKAYWYFLL